MRAEILNVRSEAHRTLDTAVAILQETHAAYWSGDVYHLPKIKAMIERLEANVQAVRRAYETVIGTPTEKEAISYE